MMTPLPVLPEWADLFLHHLAQHGLRGKAARAAGTTSTKVREVMENCIEFETAVKDAEDEAADILEQEARRRAVEGVEEDVYYQGDVVGQKTNYSDTLLATLLKARRAEVFGDKKQITGANGEPLQITFRTFNDADLSSTDPLPYIEHSPSPTHATAETLVQQVTDEILYDMLDAEDLA